MNSTVETFHEITVQSFGHFHIVLHDEVDGQRSSVDVAVEYMHLEEFLDIEAYVFASIILFTPVNRQQRWCDFDVSSFEYDNEFVEIIQACHRGRFLLFTVNCYT